MVHKLRIGTRGSRLALAQSRAVLEMLMEKEPGIELQIVPIRTIGDRSPPEKRGDANGKGAFTGDIEALLARSELDMAVHSLKDLSVGTNERLIVGATPPRGDARDALVSPNGEKLYELPMGASLGTSSIRRKAQLLNLRNDLKLVDVHGNVETRVKKMDELRLDGVVLAAAGLDRLSMGERTSQRFPVDEIVPSAGQGTIAVQVRRRDREVRGIVSKINDDATMRASKCETAFARAIGGDCYIPAGAHASVNGRSLTLVGLIASPDGKVVFKRSLASTDPVGLGETLGEELLRLGGAEIIREVAIRS